MSYYESATKHLESFVSTISTAWIPQRPWIGGFSSFGFWYGRRVALTYAPGYLANYFIRLSILFAGSETIGTITGTTIVAPIMVPSMVPYAAFATGCAFFYTIAITCNLGVKLLSRQ